MDKIRDIRIFHEVGPDKKMHLTFAEARSFESRTGRVLCGIERTDFIFDSWSWLEDTLGAMRPEDNHCSECINGVKALELIEE